jgi:hypothetical protein
VWQALILMIVAATPILGTVGFVFKRPRKYVIELIRAGRGKPYSKLHALLVGQFSPVWARGVHS